MTTKKNNEWWRGGVIYQIYPRSFRDTNGDGVGDLKGITEKLDYVASLGVDGVWLSPFFTSPMADYGYDVSDYQNVDPLFGTLADFDVMIKEMHKRGLKLIIDLVMNHTSEKHPWFVESRKSRDNPKADWYVWTNPNDDGTPINNWMSVFGGSAWQYDTTRGQYYYHQFLKEQPDLNLQNPEVQEELLRITKWWMDKGVDGFRLDALNHGMHDLQFRNNPPNPDFDRNQPPTRQTHPYYWQRHLYDKTQPEMMGFLNKLRKLTDQYPEKMMVAEIGDDFQVKTSVEYTRGLDRLHTAYSFAMLVPGVYSAKTLRAIVEEYMNEAQGASWPSWAFSNHDTMRAISRWEVPGGGNDAQAKMLIAMLTSLLGTAFIYQGEELALPEADVPYEKLKDPFGIFLWPEDKGRDGCRTPFPWDHTQPNAGFGEGEPWLPISDEHVKRAVSTQEGNPVSVLNFTRNFLQWRKQRPALKSGDITFHDAGDNVLAFTRRHEDTEMFCAFNLSGDDDTVTLPDGFKPEESHGLPHSFIGDAIKLPAFGGIFAKR